MVFDKVRTLLSEQLGVSEEEIDLNTDVVEDLGADSLDVVELIMALEEEYGLVITDEAVHDLKTVGDIVSFIEGMI